MKAFSAFWGIGGFLFLMFYAITRLLSKSIEAFEFSFYWYHWLVLIINIGFMAYSEGYKGFQLSFSPRFVARAVYLKENATRLQTMLAPLFCMGYFDAPKRRLIATFLLTVMIVSLIIAFQFLPQPWRGILDAGVVVGLSWGTFITLYFVHQAFFSDNFNHDPQVPGYGECV